MATFSFYLTKLLPHVCYPTLACLACVRVIWCSSSTQPPLQRTPHKLEQLSAVPIERFRSVFFTNAPEQKWRSFNIRAEEMSVAAEMRRNRDRVVIVGCSTCLLPVAEPELEDHVSSEHLDYFPYSCGRCRHYFSSDFQAQFHANKLNHLPMKVSLCFGHNILHSISNCSDQGTSQLECGGQIGEDGGRIACTCRRSSPSGSDPVQSS